MPERMWPMAGMLRLSLQCAFAGGLRGSVASRAIGLDWSLWRIVPDGYTLTGGAIIIASGLYLLRKEKVRTVAVPP